MARVLIADDHALFRAGLRQFLIQSLPSAEIGESATGNETLTALQRGTWDLLVLDINMPDRSGLDILRHVRSGHAGTRVLVPFRFSVPTPMGLGVLEATQFITTPLPAKASVKTQ